MTMCVLLLVHSPFLGLGSTTQVRKVRGVRPHTRKESLDSLMGFVDSAPAPCVLHLHHLIPPLADILTLTPTAVARRTDVAGSRNRYPEGVLHGDIRVSLQLSR
ncbi:hypothetical protein BC834DRAFT_301847 [Gloeopeniophorella convolvens]|nr:hypothetical protein BC834DRAFT_301847 [Gloeopeniophorella convolvens]